jgi:Ca-activated chloride channel family protein
LDRSEAPQETRRRKRKQDGAEATQDAHRREVRSTMGAAGPRRVGPGLIEQRRRRAVAEYKLAELAKAAGMTPRAVRYYLKRGLLPAAVFRGGSTRYGEEHLARLRAVQRLRAEERLRLQTIRARLAKLSPAEIAALAAPPMATPSSTPAPGPAEAAPVAGGELGERIALLPGLELHLRRDAAPVVRRFAAEVRAQCAGAG